MPVLANYRMLSLCGDQLNAVFLHVLSTIRMLTFLHVMATYRMLSSCMFCRPIGCCSTFFPFALIETWHCASNKSSERALRALTVTVLKICTIYNSLSSLDQNDGNPLGHKVATHKSRYKSKQSDDDSIAYLLFRLTLTIEHTRSQSGTESSPI
jgi:hypothetical protein